jgi:hypothetical protein
MPISEDHHRFGGMFGVLTPVTGKIRRPDRTMCADSLTVCDRRGGVRSRRFPSGDAGTGEANSDRGD